MRFSDVQTFVQAGYQAAGYGDPATDAEFPVINPGPPTVNDLLKLAVDRIVFLSVGGGAGLTTEDVFDRPFIGARTVGNQDDYTDAEKLAWDLDTMLLSLNGAAPNARRMGTSRVLYVARAGGAPVLLEKDTAQRYHFTCTYIVETSSGL